MAEILRELKQTRQQKIWIPHQCERLQQRRGSSIPQFTNSPTMTNIFKKFTHYLNWIRIPTKVLNVGQREVVQTYKNFEFFLLDNQEAMKIRKLCKYDLAQSLATISAQHASAQHMLHINTRFVEPLSATVGSHYLALGEIEEDDDEFSGSNHKL